MEKWIIIYGYVVGGLFFIGPFDSEVAAVKFGNESGDIPDDWTIAPLEYPEH